MAPDWVNEWLWVGRKGLLPGGTMVGQLVVMDG